MNALITTKLSHGFYQLQSFMRMLWKFHKTDGQNKSLFGGFKTYARFLLHPTFASSLTQTA